MCMHTKAVAAVVLLLLVSAVSAGTPGLTITGRVVDSSGRPISDATVMVYHAGVLNGYSTFCPSCYRDCGKRAKTDASGSYTIDKLDSGVWFELIFVRDGYAPEIVKVKDPSAGTAPLATLKARQSAADSSQVVKGHVVDPNGRAVRDTVVTSVGVEVEHGERIGTIPGLDPLAVTDPNGDFELLFEKPAKRILVSVEARTLALKFVTLVTGPQRQTIELAKGATVKGRLVQDGKPVADAEIGLIGQKLGGFGPALSVVGDPYPEMRVGTQQDGTFMISDVPTGVQWFVYAKMESVATRGASEPKPCMTTRSTEMVDVGEISLRAGYHLAGRVVLTDGKSVPDGMRLMLASQRVRDSQTALLDKEGRFTFLGLPPGNYSISLAVRGYRLADNQHELQASIQQNVDDFVVSLNPEQPKR
jgi:protocatechuate 3,4-dioxygenase beta subunit